MVEAILYKNKIYVRNKNVPGVNSINIRQTYLRVPRGTCKLPLSHLYVQV